MNKKLRLKYKGSKPPKKWNKLVILVTEGRETEPNYFNDLKKLNSFEQDLTLIIHKSKQGGTATALLKKVSIVIEESELESGDQIWIIVDDDEKKKNEIDKFVAWRKNNTKTNNLAVSDPNFEFWLLLHFDCDYTVRGKKDCENRLENQLRKELPNVRFKYDKSFPSKFVTEDYIWKAVDRAKQRDKTAIQWPGERSTRVYKLIELILRRV